ncbi:von Willebrand factor A domain-containing protein 3A isoform X7 [Chelonoidis abingdonii]|uniref:von Willebrand factor A domain-containing protein 3A isoform X7 n=1 Tax=Chelonoidis abingdonii TaxID=106734 RepID=UPI0013F23CD5|nr:von Willebrand factor A domain-containing protein 3A isoform X8 [Chelonoidis abingdonii]
MDAQTRKMAQLLDNDQFLEKVGVSMGSGTVPVKGRPSWHDITITDLEPDNGLLVTHINQTQDLLRVQKRKMRSSEMQTTEEWLRNHSLESMQLTLEDLLKKGNVVLNARNATEQIEFDAKTVVNFESKLSEAIELYHQRIQWLLEDSRKVFGLIKGNKVGLLVDVSDISCGPRLFEFQKDLLCLIDEQLCYKKQLYFLSFGTEISSLWENPTNINMRILDEARQWVQELQPSGGCNLLKALKKVLTMRELNSLVLIVGSCPDQSSEILCDYIQQCTLGRKLLIHTITYECSSHVPPAVLKNLAEVVGGRYHCYSSKSENYDSSDVYLLLCESQKAKNILSSIKETFQGRIGDSVIGRVQDIATVFTKLTPASFLPKPPKHEGPLVVQMPSFLAKTSAGWLKTNGLKAKKLSLYQVLAPNAFSPVEEFVPILQKTVSSTLHEKAMMQFEWHDGTVKNVHVDPPILYDYQKQLDRMVRTYERRIDWLSMASRRIWGTVCELRWVLSLQCKGSRNFMSALRRAVEVDLKDKDKHVSQGLYLLTTGVPDQEMHAVSTYVADVCGSCDMQLHVCLFSVNGFDPSGIIPSRYASPNETASTFREIAHAANGRFHWFGETGIYESDDISIIVSEMEKAVNYSQKCALLVESLKQRSGTQLVNQFIPEEDLKMLLKKERTRAQKLLPPKPTALTLARMNIKDNHEGEKNAALKALTWRPTSAKAEIPPPQPIKEWTQTSVKKKYKSRKQSQISLSVFYIDKGKNVGAVYRKYPKKKGVRRSVPVATLPKEEEICSSKEWLNKYSIKKLKLELPRIMFGPNCVHQKKTVESLHKKVSAKYCTIFPSVEINGIVKHVQFQPKELEDYVEQMERVLCCYIRRIQWLLSGSRRLFGTILETKVCILIDTSGSMDPYLQQVTKELTSLIWEQLRKNNARFNLLRFAEDIDTWQEFLVEATDETCHDAVQWVSKFQAHGNTCVLKALQKAFCFQDLEALYVLTDGKPDTSCSLILKEVEKIRKKETIKIHTISFNCSDRRANEFLKKLASQTGGRYHRCIGDMDGQLAAHRMLTEGFDDDDDPVFPFFEGDDLKKLAQEVAKARSFLMQAKSFRLLLEKWNLDQKDNSFLKKNPQVTSQYKTSH